MAAVAPWVVDCLEALITERVNIELHDAGRFPRILEGFGCVPKSVPMSVITNGPESTKFRSDLQGFLANRGPEAAELYVLPRLWFRKNSCWDTAATAHKPLLSAVDATMVLAEHPVLEHFSYDSGESPNCD